MEKFTKELCELVVNKNISLAESLMIMSNKSKGKNKNASKYLLEQLENGELFSNSLRTCPFIHFDSVYVSFITMAEKSEQLKSTLEYLDCKCKRVKENRKKMVNALIYPIFVNCLALFICIFISMYLNLANFNLIMKYFLFFLVVSTLLILGISKVLSLNKMYEAFLGTDLLVKNGVSFSSAVYYGALIAGPDSRVGKVFRSAGEKIEYGMDLINAFSFKNDFEELFYYADTSGVKTDIFEKVANWIAEKDEKRRTICLQLIEPIFVTMTGFFLLFVILNFFMPIINNFEFI